MSASLGPGIDEPADKSATTTAPAFAIGLIVGAVILGLVWVAATLVQDDPEPPSSSLGAPLVSASPGPSSATEPEVVRRTRQERCLSAAGRLETALDSVGPAMDQWRVHVGAMNKLVVGEITLQQASDFWDRTRVGAQRRLASVDEAAGPLRRRGLDCPTPSRLGRASPEVVRCAGRVAAEEQAWNAAQRALETWSQHVKDMDMLKMGHLSPQDATRMWLASWKRGVREIDDYRGAAAAARRAKPC
jgi:hypothetical protein